MSITLVTAPTTEPLTTAQAKAHIRVEHHTDDLIIDGFIRASRQHAANVTHRALITQTWRMDIGGFPANGLIELPKPPLQSVTQIQYVDADGATQTLSSSIYDVDTASEPGCVRLAYQQNWPTTRDIYNAVQITYVAGYGDDGDDVPQPIRNAMLLLIGHWYENREAVTAGISLVTTPMATDALLWPYRVFAF